MPQVIDAPDAVLEERWHQDEEKTAPLAAIAASRRARPGFLAALWAAVTALTTRHARPQSYGAHIQQPFELPMDRIAREHPFLYIKAMSG
jgi:hypothetical protein